MADHLEELQKENQELRAELAQWRKLGNFDQLIKNICYMSVVLEYMTANPDLNNLLIALMYKFNEQNEEQDNKKKEKLAWLENQLKDINFD